MPEKDNSDPNVLRRIDNFVRGVANGMTFGLADYVAGLGNAAIKGGDVRKNIHEEVDRTRASVSETPVEAIAGQLAGALATGGAAGLRAMGGMTEAAQAVRTVAGAEKAANAAVLIKDQMAVANTIQDAFTTLKLGAVTAAGVAGGANLGAFASYAIVEPALNQSSTRSAAYDVVADGAIGSKNQLVQMYNNGANGLAPAGPKEAVFGPAMMLPVPAPGR